MVICSHTCRNGGSRSGMYDLDPTRTGSASAETAIKEEIDAAVKFYDGVKVDSDKLKAYCDAKQAIGMMASDPKKFAEAQQKAAAATKQLGPEFGRAQSLQTRLDMTSEEAKRYIFARQALDKTCY